MAVNSTRSSSITFTGDTTGTQAVAAAANAASPGAIEVKTLAAGFNSMAVPSGVTCTAVTIVPPAGNTTSLTLKGVTGDTGLRLHNTDPTTIAIDSSVTAIGLTAASQIVGVRLIWS